MTRSNKVYTLPAPAKLNLFLHITGRRADGYHELETLFQFLSFGDELHFQVLAADSIDVTPALNDVPLESHLVYRAAQLLVPYRKHNSGVHIHVDKHLPMGGGVGGGSSNAATTLLALNRLWELGLSPTKLAELGLQLGADVPIFVHGQAALARGVGESFTPAYPKEAWYLVVHPGVHVSTAEIFQHPDLPRDTAPIDSAPENWQGFHNDCENLVCSVYPQVASAHKWLLNYAPSRLTGTGACVFACFSTETAAQQALRALPDSYRGFVARGVNQSPVMDALKQLP
ncbi:4-(cytidine 5'-diphospho)-2-C-methyl-D-erythritol kinase [Aliidiomarina indica]|uniref:4-(cytidine 5'-diphospho)-2-C-methyl-D-erythritol kinase n=1 Tax=Aliidiomarina indica TaxID=2749147 RepID=UPI00188DD77F|nr:4-(cytidine 5'-diphospho)-2-C-methyl-D-erythritol kinase [Aliidiomarina indica]